MIVNRLPYPHASYDRVLANNTPEQIQNAAKAGIANTLWSVGDKTAQINIAAFGHISATSVCAFIIGFNHNSTYESNNTIHFQFGMTADQFDTKIAFVDSKYSDGIGAGEDNWFNMNYKISHSGAHGFVAINEGGWKSSKMRTIICANFYNALPEEWQNVISSCNKRTDNTGNSSTSRSAVTATSDKIWLLSEYEIFGSCSYSNTYESTYQKQYDYYKTASTKAFCKHNSTGKTCLCWTRSPCKSNGTGFCLNRGYSSQTGSHTTLGFAPGFMVA